MGQRPVRERGMPDTEDGECEKRLRVFRSLRMPAKEAVGIPQQYESEERRRR